MDGVTAGSEQEGPCLIKRAGKDVQGVLLLHKLNRDAVEEAPRLFVVRRPVLCKVLHHNNMFIRHPNWRLAAF